MKVNINVKTSVCVCETHPWKNYLKEGLLTDQQKLTLDLSMRSFRSEYELNYAPWACFETAEVSV